jgi:N-hydroxyarylamine O-acetyltransferase
MAQSADNDDTLPPTLKARVVDRLGLAQLPPPNLTGLRTFYKAWCARIPFDNVRKMIALRSGSDQALPGGHAEEFFEAWLMHGCGGTCWPSSNALFALARSIGFDARRITGSMRDLGVVNHGSVAVTVDGRDWLVDSSMQTSTPLPLERRVFVSDDPVFAAEVEPAEGGFIVWWDMPPNAAYLPCRLHPVEATHDEYLASYERSRERSPFNQRLYARRNREGELLVLFGNTRYVKTSGGLSRSELTREEVVETLHQEIGLSDQLIGEWIRSGALDASLAPPSGPKPPEDARKPPSQRVGGD